MVGFSLPSSRERRPSEKAREYAVGVDPDYPTDEQAKSSSEAGQWAEARKNARAQLKKYGVFT